MQFNMGGGEINKGEGLYIIPASPFLKLPIFCTSVFLVCPLIIRGVKIAMQWRFGGREAEKILKNRGNK